MNNNNNNNTNIYIYNKHCSIPYEIRLVNFNFMVSLNLFFFITFSGEINCIENLSRSINMYAMYVCEFPMFKTMYNNVAMGYSVSDGSGSMDLLR